MSLPTTEEYLQSLYRKKRETDALIQAAENRGDLKEARALQKIRKQYILAIQKKGGDPTA